MGNTPADKGRKAAKVEEHMRTVGVTFKDMDGMTTTIKVGDHVGFKSDVEQSAEVVSIESYGIGNAKIIVKAPPDGFSGHYIGRCDRTELFGSDIWTK